MWNVTRTNRWTRRDCLKLGAVGILGTGWVAGNQVSFAEGEHVPQPIRPESTRVWRPVVDLHFDGDAGVAQWWCPELILLGNTDAQLNVDGPIAWQQQDGIWKYEHTNPDGKLFVALSVEQIALGWRAALTIGNLTDQVWPMIVSPVCLLLRGSPAFADKDWTRTYFRSGGEFVPHHGQEISSGREIYRMSLVDGQQQIERTARHVKKWGFTKRNSDDGIMGVVSVDRSTVLTTSWEPTHHLQANQRRTFSCIHANPYFGPLEPGESITRHGCVLLVPGTLEEAWQETRDVLRQT